MAPDATLKSMLRFIGQQHSEGQLDGMVEHTILPIAWEPDQWAELTAAVQERRTYLQAPIGRRAK